MSLTTAGAISEHIVPSEKSLSTSDISFDRKGDVETATVDADSEEGVLSDERDIATHVISVADDASLNPWTLRAFFIGLGLSTFGGVLAEIYYFKPQTVAVSLMFLAVVFLHPGRLMETFIPRRGLLRYLKPCTEVLAVQRLYYNITPNAVLADADKVLSYGIGGMMRSILLYPSKMLYPGVLPLLSMFDALYEGGMAARKKLRVFTWCLLQWIFPLLTGFSIFCLAAPNKAVVSRVFGGSNGNEGLGLLSICFDWQYISAMWNPMAIPLKAQVSNLLGYIFSIVVFVAVYYNNIWKAQNFPLLSQLLFYENGTQYDQMLILNSNYEVDPTLLAEQGLPYYSSTWVVYLLTQNLASSPNGLGATFTHLLLWNRSDICSAWTWMNVSGIKNIWANFDWKFWQADGMRKQDVDDDDIDPHYKQMLKLVLRRFPSGLCCCPGRFIQDRFDFAMVGLPYLALAGDNFYFYFLVALAAITGLTFNIQTFGQMIGGYLHKGLPVANMYFVLYGYNTVFQAQLLLQDLKIAQCACHPRAAFTAQILGTLLGAILNYVMMNSIIDNQSEILLSVQGTNIWSGQQPQMYNSQAIAWGGLSYELFSAGQRYQWYWQKLRADYLYTPIIAYMVGSLSAGINSSALSFFAVALLSQWWLRTRYPRWFVKYNYIVGAALDGGTQVMVFILSFAVQGAGGTSHLFPTWWGREPRR
ncbi:OPT oligopeptide transporter protein-domain-containing protein [Suillus cothurnatus]|nr:OPT oligopeptide transporter protein-domain-containing protein [Suillus cothurnatus]